MLLIFGSYLEVLKVFISFELFMRFHPFLKLTFGICFGHILHIFGRLFTMFWVFTDHVELILSFYHAITLRDIRS